MQYRITIVTGNPPNIPWWKIMFMSDAEIKEFNERFLTERVISVGTKE